MKLHSPKFEKALRQEVKRAVRDSPALKREFRRANRFRRKSNIGFVLRPLFGLVLGFLVWCVTTTTRHIASGLAVINLWMFGALFLQQIWTRLYSSPDRVALTLLPVTTEQIFRWQLQKVFRLSWFTLFNLFVGFGVLAFYYNLPSWKWAATFLLAILSWVTLLALLAFCAARLPRKPLQIISTGIILMGFVLLFGRDIIGGVAIKALDQSAPALNLLLPTGWPPSLFQTIVTDSQWWMLLLLFPVSAIVWTTRNSLQMLSKNFQYREHILAEPSDLVPGEEPPGKSSSARPIHLGPTAIEEIIQSRIFLGWPRWPQGGWWEQRLWRWFDHREQALAEFVFPNGFAIMIPWIKTFRNLLLAAVIAYAVGLVNPTWKLSVLGVGLFVTLCQALAQIQNHGRAFQLRSCSGVNIPIYAIFGIGFRELSRVLFKCSIIQIPLLLAFALAASLITAFLAEYPIIAAILIGLKFGCLLFASRFIFVTLAFSSGTNDTARFRFRAVVLVLFIILLGLLFVGLGGLGLFVPRQPISWMLCAFAMLDAFAFFWIYSWFYNSGRFDLMSLPRR